MSKPLISVVCPEYKGASMVQELVRRNVEALSRISDKFEIILVNDGSPDNTWDRVMEECRNDARVKGINLSRNFGQHYAISAGLAYAGGEWVVVMDCDLQDNPEEIIALYAKAREGWDIVKARRMNKQFGFFKKLSSTLFHKVFDCLSGQKTDPAIGNFGIYSSKVISEFNRMPERARAFGTLLDYLGFSRTTVDVAHSSRAEGKSSYTLKKLLKLALDAAISNTNKPLHIAVVTGFSMSLLAFAMALYNIIAKLCGHISIPGYTTTVFSIWFVGGLILFVLGIVGLYAGKIFDQTKGRQLYIIKDTANIDCKQ